MSIHPSLKLSDKNKKQRSVLKRTERLRIMLDKEQWKEGDEVCGLPKIKTIRIKIKKEKAEKTETAAAEGAAPAASETKTQTPAKGAAAAKTQGK
ncbi:MAG: small basic protein [Candidatus Omnitrophica bacterium]|nr:small basic protein [Candidatus Omnitrophota bacterium]MDD5591717.1 small basic protein [Candidatus Omnitrophota bacterium]